MRKKRNAFMILFALFMATGAYAASIKLEIKESQVELAPGLKTTAWTYNGTVPGTTIVARPGEELVIEAVNLLKVPTSIHWHGLEVPNDQDGTLANIAPGQSFTYRFKVPSSGTFWYHSHTRPVLDQVDRGLYGAFIVKAPEDEKYASDQTFLLDDWYLGVRGERLKGTARGGMERYGNLETVNGKTGEAIPPLSVTKGEMHKLRFINASSAAVHTLKISGHRFRVTHTDGHALTQPYLTDTLILQPSERYDVEFSATGQPGSRAEISSVGRDLGLVIPIVYSAKTLPPTASPFQPPASSAFPGIAAQKVDYTLELNSRMAGASEGSMDHSMMNQDAPKMDHGMGTMMNHGRGTMDHGMMTEEAPQMDHSMMEMGMMEWTINGKSFPNTEPLRARVGQIVKVKFINKDLNMMHPMDHPMHLHGTFFQVVSVNGVVPDRETWKDTVLVPAGGSVEIAFRFKNPGDWMLHCHVLDHEDRGMMTLFRVRE